MTFPLLEDMARFLAGEDGPVHKLYTRQGEVYCEAGDECPVCGITDENADLEICPDCHRLVDPASATGHSPTCLAFGGDPHDQH